MSMVRVAIDVSHVLHTLAAFSLAAGFSLFSAGSGFSCEEHRSTGKAAA
jgi:hypothetical protein